MTTTGDKINPIGSHSPHLQPIVQPLDIIIIGAGIAGLTAATSLRRSGHNVKIFEQSSFAYEIGAAIHVAPNASRVLQKLGWREERIRGVVCNALLVRTGMGHVILRANNEIIRRVYNAPWYLVHRVDLHNEIKHLALDEDGEGRPADLHLSSKVVDMDADEGIVTLENGDTHQADVIIGADGIYSLVREKVFQSTKLYSTGIAAYRFTLDANETINDPMCKGVLEYGDGVFHIFANPDRRIVIYPCRDHSVLNFVCLFPANFTGEELENWNSTSSVEDLVNSYEDHDFLPEVIAMLKKAENVKCWQLMQRHPIESWINGRVCLVGDAAHPMLPHRAQGGGQAIEDGGCLGPLFTLGTTRSQVPKVLQLYQKTRYERASTVEFLSREEVLGQQGSIDPIASQRFVFGHDVMTFSKEMRSSTLVELKKL